MGSKDKERVAESTLRDVREAAQSMGWQIQILNAATIGEIDAAFATLACERPDALLVGPTASSQVAAGSLLS